MAVDVNNPPDIPTIFASAAALVQQLIFGLGPILFVVALVYAGYIRLTAADNPKKVQQSTQTIMWAVVGYAIVIGAFLIVRLVASILGYPIGRSINVDL